MTTTAPVKKTVEFPITEPMRQLPSPSEPAPIFAPPIHVPIFVPVKK